MNTLGKINTHCTLDFYPARQIMKNHEKGKCTKPKELLVQILMSNLCTVFIGFGSKDETTTTEKYYRMFYAHTYSLVLSLKQIAWYSLSLIEFPLPAFSPIFQMSLDYLPKV